MRQNSPHTRIDLLEEKLEAGKFLTEEDYSCLLNMISDISSSLLVKVEELTRKVTALEEKKDES